MFGFKCGSVMKRFALGFVSTTASETGIWMLAKAFFLPHLMIQSGSCHETGMEIMEPLAIWVKKQSVSAIPEKQVLVLPLLSLLT